MADETMCLHCGKPIPSGAAGGLCPECLVRVGIGSETGDPLAGSKTAAIDLPPIEQIARCFPGLEIIAVLGSGGMGAVYKARQRELDRLVALKILPPRAAKDPGFAERFTREARSLARLSHPNVVSLFDFGQVNGLHYFIMEFVDGMTLRQLEQAGGLSAQQALQIIPQICEALQFAHSEGIVHRDIKPENVLLDRKGRVKIADFGLARVLGQEAQDFRLTGIGEIVGTAHYMAPEQVESPRTVDHRADIYSLGVVFYEMLTGELPLGKFAAPSQKVQIDLRLDEVVLKALEKEPARRYQRASEVKTEVQIISGKAGEIPTNPNRVGSPPTPKPSEREGGVARPEPADLTRVQWILERLKTAFGMQPLEPQQWMRRSLRLERNIILPIKAALAIMLFTALFLGRRGGTLMDAVGESIELDPRKLTLLFAIYIGITLGVSVLLIAARHLPMRLVHVGILVTIIADGCLIAVLAFFTGGADSPLYWLLIAMVVRSAAVEPRITVQLSLSFGLSFSYLAVGYLDNLIANYTSESDKRIMELYATGSIALWPRFLLLVLVSFCCCGVQLLLQQSSRQVPRPKSGAKSAKTVNIACENEL
ncbi:MAG TPA: protein kinase [Verrucomicrobiae bacterium]|nr:protein kinase [Verrucomicrobiae bacterium]